ncbi:MAG: protein kinase [Verrucomicrobia bacterium]|nr:protein kinase [Verrucomicrobiota bacterium]
MKSEIQLSGNRSQSCDLALEPQESRTCLACNAALSSDAGGEFCPVCMLRCGLSDEIDGEEFTGATVGYDSLKDRFEHYELAKDDKGLPVCLGRGGMGITFKAFDVGLRCCVALKVISERYLNDESARQRFLREARAAASLRHPNVASVFHLGKTGENYFYAMEYVDGETLESFVRRSDRLELKLALEIAAQVAAGLAAVHKQKLVHRDIKPSNIMVTFDEGGTVSVKIIDLGLAKATNETSFQTAISTVGGFAGTPKFASPEHFAGVGVDIRSDLYSLGVILWEMVTGSALFRGSPAELMYQHQHAPLPREQLEGVPQPVAILLEVLLEKDPARRFQQPAELLKVMPTIMEAIDAGRRISHQLFQKIAAGASTVATRRSPARRGPKKISVARLPVTGGDVFGREEDIAFLDNAWANQHVNVVTIVAWAGVGKSTLVNHWLRNLAADHYRSAELIFGWSFYRQGTSGHTSSADEFFDAALAWFGDPDPRIGTDWEKGERLAKLIANRRTLLVLDGLEPFQNPPGPQEGRVRETSFQALLRELAAYNRGLCLITSRLPVGDLADHERTSALRLDLEQLSSAAGAKLLQDLGVKGNEAELRTASDEFSGHCLALTLLGSYLTDAYGGDIRRRKEVSERLANDVRQGAHARKVMESYQTWFGEGPELSLLRILGLFDRPVDENALRALLRPSAICGLTESLTDLSPAEWRTLLAKLRRARLLAGEDPNSPGQLDTHPLVREYFGEHLRRQQIDAWKECNRRLYHFYRELAPQFPATSREMEPLFLAVICGCNAGLFREALREVYIPRIQRRNTSFAASVLGARSTLLSVLAQFFEQGRWGSPVRPGVEGQSLTAEEELFVLTQSALYLTVTRGFASPEARFVHQRVESFCQSLDRPLVLHSSLMGQWRYSLITDKLTVAMQSALRINSLAQEENDPALLLGTSRALACTQYFLGDFDTARQSAIRGLTIWHSGDIKSHVQEVDPPVVACLTDKAQSEWHLGEIDSCQVTMAEAIAVARKLNDMHGVAEALYFAACLSHYLRNPGEVERLASEVIELSIRQNFPLYLTRGTILRGWARSVLGETVQGISWIEEGMQDWRATGAILCLPFFLALKAEALYLADRISEALEAIDEAEALAERAEERWWSAELHRFRGVFLAMLGGDQTRIETSFCQAIDMAKRQGSVSLAKRAETTYAEYRRQKTSALTGRGFRLPLC